MPKGAKAWFAITPASVEAMWKNAKKERRAKIVALPAKAGGVGRVGRCRVGFVGRQAPGPGGT
jgi:hypothetical protein